MSSEVLKGLQQRQTEAGSRALNANIIMLTHTDNITRLMSQIVEREMSCLIIKQVEVFQGNSALTAPKACDVTATQSLWLQKHWQR